jgi:hypothetical protein
LLATSTFMSRTPRNWDRHWPAASGRLPIRGPVTEVLAGAPGVPLGAFTVPLTVAARAVIRKGHKAAITWNAFNDESVCFTVFCPQPSLARETSLFIVKIQGE